MKERQHRERIARQKHKQSEEKEEGKQREEEEMTIRELLLSPCFLFLLFHFLDLICSIVCLSQ